MVTFPLGVTNCVTSDPTDLTFGGRVWIDHPG
jgi:hypothetical protein